MPYNNQSTGESSAGTVDNFAIDFESMVREAFRNQPALAMMNTPVVHKKDMANKGNSYHITQFADLPDPLKSYVPGNDLLGQNFGFDNITVSRDNYIVSHQFVRRDDWKTSHVEIMGRLARSQARKVKMELDRRLFITGCLAARAAAKTHAPTGLNIHNGGNKVAVVAATVAAAFPRTAPGAAAYRQALKQLGTAMSEDNVPADNRLLWQTPYMNEVLSYDSQVFDRDFVDVSIGNVLMKLEVKLVDGFKIVKSVNTTTNGGSLPDQNLTDGPSKYQANFTVQAGGVGTPVCLVLCEGPDADAAVSYGMWEEYYVAVEIPQAMGWLLLTAHLCGIGQFSPFCAGSVEVASS